MYISPCVCHYVKGYYLFNGSLKFLKNSVLLSVSIDLLHVTRPIKSICMYLTLHKHLHIHVHMSLFVRKPVFGVSDQVRHEPDCAVTEDGQRLEIMNLGST